MTMFQDIDHHQYFNTNNVWLALRPLRAVLAEHGGFLPLPIIVNRKTVDVRDVQSPAVIQLESAMGAAIGLMPGAQAVAVPRTRFMPVKNCQDLLVLRSNRFVLNDAYHLVQHDDRPLPRVHLDQAYYRVVSDFEARFPSQVPDLRACESLTIHGDVTVMAPVRCEGNVVLVASAGAAHITSPAVFGDGTHQIGKK
jgi:UTP--glucose-1-phosphate uridylyltransferase